MEGDEGKMTYFSAEFLNGLSPPTKLNPNAMSFEPRTSGRSVSCSDEDIHNSEFERKLYSLSKAEFYTPNPVGSSGMVAFVNSRFSTVSRRDAQLLELLAPQRPLKDKDMCLYCFKRSSKNARHHFKDKENRIICPLVGYKLAALRMYRKSNPSYKEMRDINRKMKLSKKITSNDDNGFVNLEVPVRQRSASLSASSVSSSITSRSSLSYEGESQILEADYYKKLQSSEEEYSNKSNKEILAYMPISERIVSRLHQSISSCDEDKSDVLGYGNMKLSINDAGMSKTIDFSRARSHSNFGITCDNIKDILPKSTDDYKLRSVKNKRRLSLAANFINSSSGSTGSSDNAGFKASSKKSSDTSSNGQKQSRSDKSSSSEIGFGTDRTFLSSISSIMFTSDISSGYNSSNSSRANKSSEDDFSHSDQSLNSSSRSKTSQNGTINVSSEINNNVPVAKTEISVEESKTNSPNKDKAVRNLENVTIPPITIENEVYCVGKVKPTFKENVLFDNVLMNKLFKIVEKYTTCEFDYITSLVIEMWIMQQFLTLTRDMSHQKILSYTLIQKLNTRKLAVCGFLKQKLKGFVANISVTTAVVKILQFSGLFNELSRSTLHSVLFWKDMFSIWDKGCSIPLEVAEHVSFEFAKILKEKKTNSEISETFMNKIVTGIQVRHTCNGRHGLSSSSLKLLDSSLDTLREEDIVHYLRNILCFSCLADTIKLEGTNEESIKRPNSVVDSMYNVLSHLKGILKPKLETALEELELLDFFYDNRYFILCQFLKNSGSAIQHGLFFDKAMPGQVRLVIPVAEKENEYFAQKLAKPLVKANPLNAMNQLTMDYQLWRM